MFMRGFVKKLLTNSCAGCFVTGEGYADWCYGERMSGLCFWPKKGRHYLLDPLAYVGLYWGRVDTFSF